MKFKKLYICPKVKVLMSEDFMQSDIGMFSTVGDSGELAKEVDLDAETEDFGYQSYDCVWDD
ncbi:MAG: hypothetical protein IKT22_05620 [Prevotella sp.]|nr:hypothetical protein [Prevotella sp.]MBR6446500.1 hypothetical protein [Prevotella sp.]MBR6494726.1 hypothetical protein [Prevotella sp.]